MDFIKDLCLDADIPLMTDYARRWVDEHAMPAEKYMPFWYEGKKQHLLKLFDNQLIVRRRVQVDKSISLIAEEISDNLYWRLDPVIRDIRKAIEYVLFGGNYIAARNKFWETYDRACDREDKEFKEFVDRDNFYDYFSENLSTWCLAENNCNFKLSCAIPNTDRKFTVNKGQKCFKMLNNVVNILMELIPEGSFNSDSWRERIEECRIVHSQILNDKNMNGNLVLSIHPMDFMTMSDNNYNWTSCMSWMETGCYYAGTLEMMCSPYIVMAYLEGDTPFYPLEEKDGRTWSNKKWRELFIVDKNFIVSIKGYPYEHTPMELKVMQELAEMAKDNLDWEYDMDNIVHGESYVKIPNTNRGIILRTNHMYNDTDCGVSMVINKNGIDYSTLEPSRNDECNVFNYSYDTARCIGCGEYLEDEERLICPECRGIITCECCGNEIEKTEAVEIGGRIVCEYCADHRFLPCPSCGELIHEDDFHNIGIYTDIDGEKSYLHVCRNCLSLIDKYLIEVQEKHHSWYRGDYWETVKMLRADTPEDVKIMLLTDTFGDNEDNWPTIFDPKEVEAKAMMEDARDKGVKIIEAKSPDRFVEIAKIAASQLPDWNEF